MKCKKLISNLFKLMNNKLFIKKRRKFEKRQRYRAHNKQKMNSLLDTSEIYCEFQNELDS